jgi:hypothetical protein
MEYRRMPMRSYYLLERDQPLPIRLQHLDR